MFDLLTFGPGETIIAEGVVDNHLYILQAGTIAIRKAGACVARLSDRGTFVGEIAAILGEPRSCNVVAETECDVIRFAQSIDQMVVQNPQLTLRLLEEMARRIKSCTEHLAAKEREIITFRHAEAS